MVRVSQMVRDVMADLTVPMDLTSLAAVSGHESQHIKHMLFNPLHPRDALKHNFASLKTDLIF